jgi:hypothetical protein
VVAAEAGASVTVLIDDGAGTELARVEQNRLEQFGAQGRPVGTLSLASTLTVSSGRPAGSTSPAARR